MLDRELAFFTDTTQNQQSLTPDDAAAVLLIEIMMADQEVDPREQDCIADILSKRANDSPENVLNCINLARQRQQESYDLYEFTRTITEHWTEQQRYQLVVDLWQVAFADGQLDKYEDHRIRRVAELLHLHHSHFIRAKAAAQAVMCQ